MNTYEVYEATCPPCPDQCDGCELDGTCIECGPHRISPPECYCEPHHYETVALGVEICEACDVRCDECVSTFYNCLSCATGSMRTGVP